MIEWKEQQIPYEAPDGIGAPPVPPRSSFVAQGTDGARLEAFRWGSMLGQPFMLELRRYGAPRAVQENAGPRTLELARGKFEDAELPHLGELQAAVDQLIPPGVMLMLVVLSNGPNATYPSNGEFFVVRVAQPAVPNPRATGSSGTGLIQ